jgi:hypothetical protein
MTNKDQRRARAQALLVALFLTGCAGESPPEHIGWVRADGKPLTSQFVRDSTACQDEVQKANRAGNAEPTATKAKAINDVLVRCMAGRGYVEIRQDIR